MGKGGEWALEAEVGSLGHFARPRETGEGCVRKS